MSLSAARMNVRYEAPYEPLWLEPWKVNRWSRRGVYRLAVRWSRSYCGVKQYDVHCTRPAPPRWALIFPGVGASVYVPVALATRHPASPCQPVAPPWTAFY